MRYTKLIGFGLMAVALVTGCGEKTSSTIGGSKSTEKKASNKEDNHAHGKGPNGGIIFDLGKYHAEFTVDHPAKEATVLFVTGDDKDAKPVPVAAEELILTTKETKTKEGKVVPPMIVKLLPKDAKDGKASRFVGTDPGIGNVADFEGTVTSKIDGKPASGNFKD